MTLVKSQNGFFAMLLVAITSFALWSTMSTMYIYSANKSESLAKIKEIMNMDSVMAEFAIEVRDAFYRHYIENGGNVTVSDCPDNHRLCELDSGKNLCVKNYPLDNCSTCLTTFHGQDQTGVTTPTGFSQLDDSFLGYCADFTSFDGNDVFGDCAEDNILCTSVAINADDRTEPPVKEALSECTSCFVQPLKIYLDIPPVTTTTVGPLASCPTGQINCGGVCTTPGCTSGSCGPGEICKDIGTCSARCTPRCFVRIEGGVFCKYIDSTNPPHWDENYCASVDCCAVDPNDESCQDPLWSPGWTTGWREGPVCITNRPTCHPEDCCWD